MNCYIIPFDMADTAKITFHLNAPKGSRGPIDFMIGINDEKIAEGLAGETVTAELPLGIHQILVLARTKNTNSWTGTTEIVLEHDMSLKIKYGILQHTAKLVVDD